MLINNYIDHTLLKADANLAQIKQLCDEAVQHKFFAVCVNSSYVSTCKDLLKNSSVKIASVVGFPLGTMDTTSKAFETAQAIKNGADEIDMVIHIGALKDQRFDYVQEDIAAVVQAANGRVVKVILETSMLTNEEKKKACELSLNAGAHFVKTSTGFGGGGATLEDIELMKSVVQNKAQIKASGGVKTYDFAEKLIKAGATRLGTSSGVALVTGQTVPKEGY